MTTPQDYRTLVDKLEAIQESPASVFTPKQSQSIANAVTSPDTSGSVLRALLTTGMSVVPEIVAFLMKNKSQLSPKCQGILQQFDTGDKLKAPSPQPTWSGPATYDPSTTGSAPSPQPTPATGGPAVAVPAPGKSV